MAELSARHWLLWKSINIIINMHNIDFKHADFHRVDLNLLVAFDALMQERHVGRAAARVFLGQPAMSHALARLRDMLGDPLFIRSAKQMEPTAYALELAPKVRAWLEAADGFLFGEAAFDPARAEATIRIAMPDGLEALLLPPLLAVLHREAPGVRLRAQSLELDQLLPALDAQEIDLAVAASGLPLRDWHHHQLLLESRFNYLYSERQLKLPRPATLALLAEQNHVVSSYRGEAAGMIDRFFAKHGLERRIAAVSASLLAINHIVTQAPLVTIQPSIYAALYRDFSDLVMEPLPEELIVPIGMIWHRRNDSHPLHDYLRAHIERLVVAGIFA